MPRTKPSIFIGSTSEAFDPIVSPIKVILTEKGCEIITWKDDFFYNNRSVLDSLYEKSESFDFAVFVITADDVTISRGKEFLSVRDNVLFEFGLFMGVVGRERTFALVDKELSEVLPSDLWGIQVLRFDKPGIKTDTDFVKDVCNRIISQVEKFGISNFRYRSLGKRHNHFDYRKYSANLVNCKKKIKILHTYIYPFTELNEYQDYKHIIIKNISDVLDRYPDFDIKFLFLNPYSPNMEARIMDRKFSANQIHNDIMEMYGFLYLLKYTSLYKNIAHKFSIKVYNQMPPFAMFQVDDFIHFATYPKGKTINNTDWFCCNSGSVLGAFIRDRFYDIRDNDSFDISRVYFLEIFKGHHFHYIKSGEAFFIGISKLNSRYSKSLDEKNGHELTLSWFTREIIGTFSTVEKLDRFINIAFKKKFPGEKFIRFYLFSFHIPKPILPDLPF